jgi:hypothetical protein
MLASNSVGEGRAANDTSDPLDRAVSQLLAAGRRSHDLGACLATLGISHVLLPKQADWTSYSFLARQHDLVLERRWSDLLLYRNTRPTGLALQVDRAAAGPCNTHVTPLPSRIVDPGEIELAHPVPAGRLVALAEPAGSSWKLDGRNGRLLASAIPAFRTSAAGTETFVASASTVVRRNELIGLAALLALALARVVVALRSSTRARRERDGVPASPSWPPRTGAGAP